MLITPLAHHPNLTVLMASASLWLSITTHLDPSPVANMIYTGANRMQSDRVCDCDDDTLTICRGAFRAMSARGCAWMRRRDLIEIGEVKSHGKAVHIITHTRRNDKVSQCSKAPTRRNI